MQQKCGKVELSQAFAENLHGEQERPVFTIVS